MDDKIFKDPQLKSLLRESKVNLPFSDFENRMVSQLKNTLAQRRSIWKSIRLSWLFFIIGTGCGIGVSLALPLLQTTIAGIDIQMLRYPIMIVTLLIILWQFEEMLKLTARQRKNRLS